jgi:hypothetical protein
MVTKKFAVIIGKPYLICFVPEPLVQSQRKGGPHISLVFREMWDTDALSL